MPMKIFYDMMRIDTLPSVAVRYVISVILSGYNRKPI